jgi:hypothetical protein
VKTFTDFVTNTFEQFKISLFRFLL